MVESRTCVHIGTCIIERNKELDNISSLMVESRTFKLSEYSNYQNIPTIRIFQTGFLLI